jgi:hypothetical protein
MKAHPASGIFPLMSVYEFTNLKNDINEHGVREPIWTFNGMTLDGRHRERACSELGIPCPARVWPGKEEDAEDFVASVNLKRRHLNPSQVALVAAKIAALKKAKKDNKISILEPENLAPKGAETKKAAAMVGAGLRSTQRAEEVLRDGSTALVKAVESGEIRVTKAAEIAKTVPKKDQVKAIKEKRTPKTKAPKPTPVPVDTVPKADYDKLVDEYTELMENREDLAAALEGCLAVQSNEHAIKIKQLLIEKRTCERSRDEAMLKVVDLDKQCKWWKKQAEKLGWKPK